MVLSSLSPLFILWAMRGNEFIPDKWFILGCIILAVLPTAFLYLRIRTAKKMKDIRSLAIGTTDDHRSHVLVYLFAMLLPFYRQELDSYRELTAMLVALGFIVFLFWHLNLHYMNIYFALFNYRVFSVRSPTKSNMHGGLESFVLITRRSTLYDGDRVTAYRVSDTVFLEK